MARQVRLIETFCPKILGPWWGPTKAFYSSVTVDGMVVVPAGGWDTQPLYVVIDFLVLVVVGTLKPSV